jgi:transcriptional regulator with XRE-family HTH domain
MRTLGKTIKDLRESKKNLTQAELAKLLDVSPAAVSSWEQYDKIPTKDMLIKIADFFEVSLDYLLCRSDIRGRLVTNEELKTFLPAELVDNNKIRFWIVGTLEENIKEIKQILVANGIL